MSGPDISQLGNWDDHQNSAQRGLINLTASSTPSDGVESQPPVQHHRHDVIEQTLHLDDLLQEKRVEEGVPSNGLEHQTSLESFKGARIHGLAYTSSICTDSEPSSFDQPSIVSTPESQEVQFIQPSVSVEPSMSPPCAKSPVNIARFRDLQSSSSTRESQARRDAHLVSKKELEVIDLTGCEESEEEADVHEMLMDGGSHHTSKRNNNHSTSRGRSSLRLSTPTSLLLSRDHSLFTPPPRRRRRMLIDYVAVPSLPNGLTKDDYHPMRESRVVTPIQTARKRAAVGHDESPFIPPEQRKGKEREIELVSPPTVRVRRRRKPRAATTFGADIDTTENALLDAYYAHVAFPLGDVDVYPPLSFTALAANARFVFAREWRKNAKRLPLVGETTGDVAQREIPKWELVSTPHKVTRKQRIPGEMNDARQMKDWSSVMEAEDTATSLASSCDPQMSVLPSSLSDQCPAMDIDADVDMDQYLNDLGDSPNKSSVPQRDASSPNASFHPMIHFTGPSLFNAPMPDFPSFSLDPVLGAQREGRDGFLGLPPSPTAAEIHPQDSDLLVPPLQPEDRVVVDDDFTHIHSGTPTNTWSFNETGSLQQDGDSLTTPPLGESSSIAFSTINPTLLGGEQGPEPPRESAISEVRSKLPGPIVYMRRPLHSSGLPVASGGKRAVQIKFRDQDLPTTAEIDEDRAIPVTASKGKGKKKERTPADVIRSDAEGSTDVVTAGSASQKKRARLPSYKIRISKGSMTRVGSGAESDFVPSPASERLSTSLPPTNADRPKVKLKPPRETPGVQEIVLENTFCHQCRNTTTRPKMQCSNKLRDGRVCGKRFCQRCILRRYSDITFDQFSAGFLCPMCTNTCNCSSCCKRRGEEFISMRVGDFVGSRAQSKVLFVSDAPKVPRSSRSGGNASETVQVQENKPTFWAHVYGMEGERVGSAFIGREHAASLFNNAPIQPPVQPSRPKKQGPPIFIGQPQKSWKIRSVRDLDPAVDGASGNKGKGKVVDGRSLRLYIGDPTFLHRPFERMPVSPTSSSSLRTSPEFEDSDGTLTPLSELEEGYWPQPDVGESCLWQPPSNPEGEQPVVTTLSEEQVAKAIHVALAAIS